jgi:hypothetical protein
MRSFASDILLPCQFFGRFSKRFVDAPNSGSDRRSEETLAAVINRSVEEAPRDAHAGDRGDEFFADSECWRSLQ